MSDFKLVIIKAEKDYGVGRPCNAFTFLVSFVVAHKVKLRLFLYIHFYATSCVYFLLWFALLIVNISMGVLGDGVCERERTLFATQIETKKNIRRYKSLHAWQVARKGITPIELAT